VTVLDPYVGKQYGDYIIEERIGQGGMATVYRARQVSMSRDVAVKVINLQDASNRVNDFQKRFAKEAEFIASLEHLHILPVYAYGIDLEVAYLAMRLLNGGSVKDLLKNNEPIPQKTAIKLFKQVCDGLAYAHSKNIIHRDLKPGNILLDHVGNAFLTDFGLAKWINADGDITQQGTIVGTITYMSPEQLRGDKLDQRADIYSMGVVFYEMLCGVPPFKNESGDPVSVVYKHLEQTPPSLIEINTNISPDLEAVVLKALEKKPAERYQTIGEFVKAVDDVISNATTDSMRSVTATAIAQVQKNTTSTQDANASEVSSSITIPLPSMSPTNIFVMLVVIAALVFGGAGIYLSTREPAIEPYTVRLGERQDWDTLAPTDQQISTAQRALGENGFVAVVACNSTSEYHSTLTRETTTRLRQYGLTFRVYDSDSDGYKQRLAMEQALIEGAKAFIICPIEVEVIVAPLQTIRDQNIPVASYAHPIDLEAPNMVYTASETSDYEMGFKVGVAAGNMIVNELNGEARMIILDFPDMDNIIERANGIEEGVLSIAPNTTFVGRYTGGTPDFGFDSVNELLEDGVEFDVIGSINDAGALGAVRALDEADIPFDTVSIYSVDAEASMVDLMKKGEYVRGSLEVGRTQVANATADIITTMLAGGSVPQVVFIPPLEMRLAEDIP
jgi:serine/threonine protein kinase/DNA-binding LacI/PurR family transcriptional regulator